MGIALAVIASNATIDSGPLTSAFATYGNEINRVGAFLPAGAAVAAATNAATASALVLRDGAGGGQFAGTLSAAIFAASGNVSVQGTTLLVGAATLQAALLVQAAATFQSTAAFTGAITATGGVVGNASTASGLLAPVGFNALSAEYRPSVNAAVDTITLGAGGDYYPDSSGNMVAPTGAQNVSLSNAVSAAQPTGTQAQWVLFTLPPGSTTPTKTGGVVALTAGAAVPPSNPALANWPIALVLRRGAGDNPGGLIAAADIHDLRGKGWGSGGAGGSGNDAGVRAAPVWTQGADLAVFGSGHDSTNAAGTETGRFNANLINSGNANDALLSDLTRDFIPLSVMSRLSVSGAVATLNATAATTGVANSGPVAFSIAGRYGVVAANISSGSATLTADQPRFVFLGIAVSGTPTLRISSTSSAGPYEALVCTVLVNHAATALDPASIDWTPLLNLTSALITLTQVPRADAGGNDSVVANGLASFVRPTNTPTTAAFTLAAQSRVRVHSVVSWQIGVAPAAGEYFFVDVLVQVNGSGSYTTPVGYLDARIAISQIAAHWDTAEKWADYILPPGTYQLAQAVSFSGSGTSTGTMTLAASPTFARYLTGDIYKG